MRMIYEFYRRIVTHLQSDLGEWKQEIIVTHTFGETDSETVINGVADWILQKTLTRLFGDDTMQSPVKPLCSPKEEK